MSVAARKRRKNIKQIVLERTLKFYAKMRRLRKKLKNEKKPKINISELLRKHKSG